MTQGEMFSDLALEQQHDNMIKALTMKQTAVEWVVGHLIEYGFDLSHHELEINKAKEMEKEQKGYSEEEVFELCKQFATFIQQKRPSYKKQLEWFELNKKK